MRATGLSGELRHGYQQAAELGPWVIKDEGPAFVFRAPVTRYNAVWMARKPLDLSLTLGGLTWTWNNVAAVVSGDVVKVELTRKPDVSGASWPESA